MKQKTLAYLLLLICALAFPAAPVAAAGAARGATVRPARSATVTQRTAVCDADRVAAGGDVGARVNACATRLGAGGGEIHLTRGGTISTQIIVRAGQTLRLKGGTYRANTPGPPILLADGATLTADSFDAVLEESTAESVPGGAHPRTGQSVFAVAQDVASNRRNGDPSKNIRVRGVHFRGARNDFNSAHQTVSLGNCAGCEISGNWLDRTRTIGVQLGGSSQYGYYASNSRISGNLLTDVASQAIALVNGQDIEISNNRVLRAGQRGGPGSSSIDLEANGTDDRFVNVRIFNNLIDHRRSEITPTGNGIIVNIGSASLVQNVVVENNTIIGGDRDPTPIVTNYLSNGIYVFGPAMKNVTVRNNSITRTGQSGIRLEGENLVCEDNKLDSVGGGGVPGFVLHAVRNSRVRRNTMACAPEGPCDGRLVVEGGSRNNIIEGNRGFQVVNQ